jgi:hypothetical protein
MATKSTITPAPTPATIVVAAPYGAEGPLIAGTSQTPNPVDTLSAKSFTINEYNRSFYLNTRLRATAVGFSDTFFEGLVTAWDGQIVTILPDLAHNPSATIYSNWNLNVAGQPGIQGIQGPVGAEGPSGGPVGPQGPPGVPGAVWRNGTGAPANSLGADGDYYLQDDTGDVWLRAVSIYSIVANIHGAAGATGAVGPIGPQGPQGIIEEAPTDGGFYARQNAKWASPPGGGNVSAGGTPTAGQLAQWSSPNTIIGITSTYGNVSATGTPTVNQWAQWTDATHVQGVATGATPWVQKAGDSMSGDLVISKANPLLDLRKTAAGQTCQIFGRNGTSLRWNLNFADVTAESGGNAGSDFTLNAYDDTGNYLSSPLQIMRSNGFAQVVGDPIWPLGIATKQYVDSVRQYYDSAPHCGLLTLFSITQLKFAPFNGNKIKINGTIYDIPPTGIAGLTITGVYLDGIANQVLAANTTYLVFAFLVGSTITADFRTAASHATSPTAGNVGTEVMYYSPNYYDTETLIGIVRTTTSPINFADSPTQRFVRSWFNRNRLYCEGVPLSGMATSYTVDYSPLGSTVEWVNFSDDAIEIKCPGFADNNNTGGGVDYVCAWVDGIVQGQAIYVFSRVNQWASFAPTFIANLAEGYHSGDLSAFVSAGTGRFYGTTYVTIG